ncbi:MAG: NADH:flavin oxidoreductase [Rhodospirillaceae bacterium]|jgi:2,4-dienoyl-CoA reductase-like NADH-dependent reductase (Old Yellow Enzyme family)|nr:NADH:flavin oxidoreductase [Rhodospirillaceae bacterium]MBT5945732.1 NADH:flavin oxidoreductase [Rhodospirillaceae bacterium]MBT6403262.1 NADH:flavin oxidoreductase [Rhodospirillaceae bacterium]MBT6534937.1 NADH:flavin oxidoreductase [Rhodospirillaceae bacterium]MBT7362205.1 NADH:flavin oxidoreductase [Rhodospirillaceae bacterium]
MNDSSGAARWPHILSPFCLGPLDLPNRSVVAPMTRISADADGVPTAQMAEHYAAFARGGFGLIITEGTHPDTAQSQGYRDQPGIVTPAQVEGWRRVVDAVHAAGGRIVLQLMHAGALVQENRYTDDIIAPSAVQPAGNMGARYYGDGPFHTPRAMTGDEIAAVVASFETAAANAMTAGFDGVEIHGANGYLPVQFLTPESNARTDGYGGSLENRLRFHLEIMAAVVRGVAGRGLAGMRMSQSRSNDFNHKWAGGVDDAKAIFEALAGAGADYIHVSTHQGLGEEFDSGHTLAGLAREYAGVPVIACGKLEDPSSGEQLLAAGEADLVAIARGAIGDPSWPDKLAKGEAPVAFAPEMISPFATLDATDAWRTANGVTFGG